MLVLGCTNPFAPKEVSSRSGESLIGDQSTIEGVFQNFRYAYIFKDTLVYGKLLAPDFLFVFRNYDKGVDVTWGRQEDMNSTYRLFNAAQSIDLIWNSVTLPIGDSLLMDVSRGFSLNIIFSPTDAIRVQGRANFKLKRAASSEPWLISVWRDDSNY